jgi:demethylmenaquinone methyltransferase/2-methoxy-6-polyprenyl-1,4-benzoquinol methylase
MFTGTAHNYDLIVKLATLGMDLWWKRRLFGAIPRDREFRRILDLGCGTGIITLPLARRFPDAEIVGIDLMPEYLDLAREKVEREGMSNVSLEVLPIEEMGQLDGAFDLIVGGFIPKLVEIDRFVDGCETRTEPGSVLLVHDFVVPTNKVLRCGYRAHWGFVSTGMKLLGGGWPDVSRELRKIIWASNWQKDLTEALTNAGFGEFYVETQPLQVAKVMRAVRTA